MYLIRVYKDFKDLATGLNPYSNGTMYLIPHSLTRQTKNEKRLNPYSNGTMYLMSEGMQRAYEIYIGLNPYSNGTMYLMWDPW